MRLRNIVVCVCLICLLVSASAVAKRHKGCPAKPKADCSAVLKQISIAKEQWAMDNRKHNEDPPALSDLAPHMSIKALCSNGGTYTVGALDTNPSCSVHGKPGDHKASPSE